ncbi:glycosyltransferase family A protein [Aphanothece stagnina]|uniref:glycosyltransferase family A protein n=1 Tax=Aphanothece stagnina TaxID=1004305 RepID=UPI00398E6AB7
MLIGLTTIRGREGALKRTLASLLGQIPPGDGRPVELHLFLSHQPYLLDQGFAETPAFIERLIRRSRRAPVRLHCHFVANTGPYRKLLPLLEMLTEEQQALDPYLITADDDTLYPRDWLIRLLEAQERLQCVVGFRGRRMVIEQGTIAPYHSWIKHDPSLLEPHPLTVPTGKDGICYRLSQLHAGVRDTGRALALAGHADDLWFKHHTLMLGVPSALLNPSLRLEFPELTASGRRIRPSRPSGPIHSLFLSINKSGGNDAVLRRLVDPTIYPLVEPSPEPSTEQPTET